MNDQPPKKPATGALENVDESSAPVAGQRLAQARRANEISIAEIAKELHLDESKVQALEENQFSVLGAPVFAKGHLRKYAELVGVPVDDMLADYYELNRSAGAPPVVGAVKRKPPQDFVLGPWVVGIAVAVLLAGALYWWFGQGRAVALTTRAPGVLEPFAFERDAAEDVTEEKLSQPAEVVTFTASAALDSVSSQASAGATGELQIDLDAEELPNDQSGTGVSLVLTFNGDCWTEVTDASGELLFFGLGKSGQIVTRTGIPPLHALFGESDNVSVTVNGVVFQIPAASRRGNTARVTIDAR